MLLALTRKKVSGALSAARTIKMHESWPRYATGWTPKSSTKPIRRLQGVSCWIPRRFTSGYNPTPIILYYIEMFAQSWLMKNVFGRVQSPVDYYQWWFVCRRTWTGTIRQVRSSSCTRWWTRPVSKEPRMNFPGCRSGNCWEHDQPFWSATKSTWPAQDLSQHKVYIIRFYSWSRPLKSPAWNFLNGF